MNKKFALLLVLVAAMVMGSVAGASAADIKATGSWTVSADWMTRSNFSEIESRTFTIAERARTAFQFVANENLKAVLETQIGTASWGNGALSIGAGRTASTTAAGAASAGAGNIMLRKGYLDFMVPGTKVNVLAGFQGLSLPSAVGGGSAIFDDQVGAVAVVAPVMDSLSLVGGYARPLEATATSGSKTSMDMVFAYADVKLSGVNLQPFAAYANIGAKSGVNTNMVGLVSSNSSLSSGGRAYFAGIAATVTAFDPIKIMADVNYGKAITSGASATQKDATRSGWLLDLQVDYTGLSMMTPSLVFSYTSGENGNSTSKGNGNSERMPVVGNPQNYALTTFWMQGSNSLTADGLGNTSQTNLGYWLAGLQLRDIKFIDKLTHTLAAYYIKGTNNVDYVNQAAGTTMNGNIVYGQTLTTKDSLWEVDLNTKYQIYSELSAMLELGYINPSFNKATWTKTGSVYSAAQQGNKDAYKATVTMNYSF